MPLNDIQPTSLRAWIIKSLEHGEMLSGIELCLFRKDRMEVNQKDETEYWDYKADLDLDNSIKVAQLAKWVLGFHNANGGVVIVGVNDKYKATGFYESKIVDSAILRSKIKKYTGIDIGLFQGRIEASDYAQSKKVIWLIFVPKRKKEEPPVAIAENGPRSPDGSFVVQKGQYYIRMYGETKLCVSPNDFERLFTGVSFKHLSAYSYDVNEPFFRLLSPHQTNFIGREQLLQDVRQVLQSRHFIFSLDGVGGVGKSALAIELARRLYEANEYDFIVSLSAKNRVWTKHSESRRAHFSGLTEFLCEIATVLDVPTVEQDVDSIKRNVIEAMRDLKGLLLIDNIEEIKDATVFEFLQTDVPPPVKVLVTSRVRHELGARKIPVPEMTEAEAIELFQSELDQIGYAQFKSEAVEVRGILKATGYLPLAIKWMASLAAAAQSPQQVLAEFRRRDTSRKEFLEFCFSTMYDGLTPLAREVAVLCPYLDDEWNTLTLSLALEQSPLRIAAAINELEDKGIIFSSSVATKEAFSMLPLTVDFLSDKWKENRTFREEVISRISAVVTSTAYGGNLFGWPLDERVRVLRQKVLELEERGETDKALELVRLAIQWAVDEEQKAKLSILEGRLIFKTGTIQGGIEHMLSALGQIQNESDLSEDMIFLAQSILAYGRRTDENIALEKIAMHIGNSSRVTQDLVEEFCERTLKLHNYTLLSKLISNLPRDFTYLVAKIVWPYLHDRQIIYESGQSLIKLLRYAASADEATETEKTQMLNKANEIRQTLR
jgi:hypothetical protein